MVTRDYKDACAIWREARPLEIATTHFDIKFVQEEQNPQLNRIEAVDTSSSRSSPTPRSSSSREAVTSTSGRRPSERSSESDETDRRDFREALRMLSRDDERVNTRPKRVPTPYPLRNASTPNSFNGPSEWGSTWGESELLDSSSSDRLYARRDRSLDSEMAEFQGALRWLDEKDHARAKNETGVLPTRNGNEAKKSPDDPLEREEEEEDFQRIVNEVQARVREQEAAKAREAITTSAAAKKIPDGSDTKFYDYIWAFCVIGCAAFVAGGMVAKFWPS